MIKADNTKSEVSHENTKKIQLLCGLSWLLLILSGCSGGDSSGESRTKATKPNTVTVQPRAGLKGFASGTGALAPLVPFAVDGTGKKLLAVYMVGSDLEGNNGAGTTDFKEMVAATGAELDNLEVIVAFGGASNWKGMWFANPDQIRNDSLDGAFSNESESEYLYAAPQAHMGDASSLKFFLKFLDSYTNFDQRMLVFWDHGANLEGFGNDENFNNDPLQLKEIEDSLATTTQTYNVIGFDSCLMATLEVAKVVRSKANFLLASEELEPGHGWNWKHALEAYAAADNATAAAKSIIDNFVAKDSHPYEDSGKTLSVVDLSKYEDVVNHLDAVLENLTEQLQGSDPIVISALNNSTSKTQAYGKSAQSGTRSSVDLKHMSHLTQQRVTGDDQKSRLAALIAAIDDYVVYSKEDGTRPNSWGVAIDAPENAVKPIGALTNYYNSLRVSENWVNFAKVYSTAKASDTTAPIVANYVTETNAANVSFDLENWDEEWDTSWAAEEGAASEGEPTAQGDSSIFCEDELSTERSNRAARYLPFLIGDRRNTVKVKTNRNARSCVSGATEGALATFEDPNLSLVRTIYGISEEYEEGTYFSVIAELNAYPTQAEGQYFTPEWDQRWYTIKVNADESIFMPLYFEDQYQENGQTYSVYVGEIDYYDSEKDYEALGYDFPADYALLRLVVNESSEVTQYGIQTYKLQFRDEDDEEGYILIDKTTETFKPNDKLQFFTYAFNLNDLETGEEWFEVSEVVEVTQVPEFKLELLELADEFGESVTFQYVMYGEDANGNGVLTDLSTVAENGDGTLETENNNSGVIGAASESICEQAGQNDEPVCYVINGTQAKMYGVLLDDSLTKFQELQSNYPSVREIVLMDVPGSGNDNVNLSVGRALHKAGFNTRVEANSMIASEGVDYFLAGNQRIVVSGAKIGVHSWATDDGAEGKDLPQDDPQHDPYLSYYEDIEFVEGRNFYFFTLDAAASDSMHYMTDAEILQYGLATE